MTLGIKRWSDADSPRVLRSCLINIIFGFLRAGHQKRMFISILWNFIFIYFPSSFQLSKDPHLQPLWDAFDAHWNPDAVIVEEDNNSDRSASSESFGASLLAIEDRNEPPEVVDESPNGTIAAMNGPFTNENEIGQAQPPLPPVPETLPSVSDEDPAKRAKLLRMELIRPGGVNT